MVKFIEHNQARSVLPKPPSSTPCYVDWKYCWVCGEELIDTRVACKWCWPLHSNEILAYSRRFEKEAILNFIEDRYPF